jgi:hypothetical protein
MSEFKLYLTRLLRIFSGTFTKKFILECVKNDSFLLFYNFNHLIASQKTNCHGLAFLVTHITTPANSKSITIYNVEIDIEKEYHRIPELEQGCFLL